MKLIRKPRLYYISERMRRTLLAVSFLLISLSSLFSSHIVSDGTLPDDVLGELSKAIGEGTYGRGDLDFNATSYTEESFENGKMTEGFFESYLDTAGIPDPDLLIRTSGEQRLSNFLLWQLAYTEFCFVDVPWPDFHEEELEKAIAQYNNRDRRFGGVKEE